MHHTITGVDLAKEEIQVCVSKRNKVQTNQAMTPTQFTSWLATSKPMTIVFEACGTSNYWKQLALKYGHDARLISAKLVANVRQNQTLVAGADDSVESIANGAFGGPLTTLVR